MVTSVSNADVRMTLENTLKPVVVKSAQIICNKCSAEWELGMKIEIPIWITDDQGDQTE